MMNNNRKSKNRNQKLINKIYLKPMVIFKN